MLFSRQDSTIQKTHFFLHIKIMELAIVGKKQARKVCDSASRLALFCGKNEKLWRHKWWHTWPQIDPISWDSWWSFRPAMSNVHGEYLQIVNVWCWCCMPHMKHLGGAATIEFDRILCSISWHALKQISWWFTYVFGKINILNITPYFTSLWRRNITTL